MTPLRTTALWVAYGSVIFGAVGVTLLARPFAKMRLGPLYLLEVVFLLWLFAALASGSWPRPFRELRTLWPLVLFFAWGAARLGMDALNVAGGATETSVARTLQHALIFVYPLLWAVVGHWAAITRPKLSAMLAWGVLGATMAPVIFWGCTRNFSVGSLAAVLLSFLLIQVFSGARHERSRTTLALLAALVCVVTILPFWLRWTGHVQRTSVVILLFLIIATPLCFWFAPVRRSALVGAALLPLGVLVISFVATPLMPNSFYRLSARALKVSELISETLNGTAGLALRPRSGKSMQEQRLELMAQLTERERRGEISRSEAVALYSRALFQHGEDVSPRGGALLGMRTRRAMWRSALQDWRQRPILGIGFLPEVPSHLFEGRPNTGDITARGAPPISGPHCSYLSILTRMGLIGALLFVVVVGWWSSRAVQLWRARPPTLYRSLLLLVPLNGAIYATVNVGFESPHMSIVMSLFTGMLVGELARARASHGQTDDGASLRRR